MVDSSIRTLARSIIDGKIPKTGEILSEGPTEDLFKEVTGLDQGDLLWSWTGGGNLTSCNAFTGWFSRKIGSDTSLGFFELESELKKQGREIAYVSASSGARPKYGDIFRATSFHVGVSLDCGSEWETAEGGQGGKTRGVDSVCRKKRPYNAANVQGWIDIDLYFAAMRQSQMLPALLTGWWKVTDGATTDYWWFGTAQENKNLLYKKLQRVASAPTNLSQGPANPLEIGNFVLGRDGKVTVSWKNKPVGEKLGQSLGTGEKTMKGTRNGLPITAVKLDG